MDTIICCYSRSVVTWLREKFPGAVELDSCASDNDDIIHTLQLFLPGIEFQTTTQGKINLSARIREITGLGNKMEQLQWLLDLLASSKFPDPVKDELYATLKLFVKWTLDKDAIARAFLQLPLPKQATGLKDLKPIQCLEVVKQKIHSPLPLSMGDRSLVLDAMKTSLALFLRETDPITYGDPGEVEIFDMGRGLGIALVGMRKEKRLSLESYIGYMAFRNGVPIAYGGGWIWGQRCRVGISIYPAFRKGESAWLFAQVLRLYYQHYKVRRFIVRPNQFGEDNPEGLKTGAFWFYYKLGLRPRLKDL